MRVPHISLYLAAFSTFACAPAVRRSAPDSLVDSYRQANCVAFGGLPPIVELRDGTEFSIARGEIQGGPIAITELSTGKMITTSNSGDYVEPTQVRFNPENSRLYVQAKVQVGGIWPTTDLFEYDLAEKRLLQRAGIGKASLLAGCEASIAGRAGATR